jgi:sulfur relay (sulfurtransferase) complex TusBCD TusD component (DsrE family)
MGENLVIMLRHSPFNSVRVHEALRSCVGLSMGDSPLQMIFVEDGVYALSSKVKPVLTDFDWNKHVEMLEELEFELIVDKAAAEARGVTDLAYETAQMKTTDEIAAILKDAKAVITY